MTDPHVKMLPSERILDDMPQPKGAAYGSVEHALAFSRAIVRFLDANARVFETRPVDAAGGEGADLPEILLGVSGDVFSASDTTRDCIQWGIYAEAETQDSARSRVVVDGNKVADITVHSDGSLADEVQEVCAALVWSAIRAVRIKRLASSTGFSPPLVPEETVRRVVPSGGEIGAPSGDEEWTARERDLYFENGELKRFLGEARKAAVDGLWASRPGETDDPYKECVICGAKCGEEAIALWHHETCWANEYDH